MQAGAAVFFLVDALGESNGELGLIEAMVALGLLLGIAYATRNAVRLIDETHRQEEALAVARGALADLVEGKFAEWQLSPAESDVALFALKGSTIAEIATLRGAAEGTVRSQLSQVYAKAGVSGQPGLMALFLEELVDGAAVGARTR
ncbi:MAG: hypothetical protein KDE15_09845 [Erythrobacter sp.]|nr:hypothetical protein [Erythrobacter sp.]